MVSSDGRAYPASYTPKCHSCLHTALRIKEKATAAARDATERCGALCGSFSEAADTVNDFAHASDHLHDCCLALGLGNESASKEYRFCHGLLYRLGAESVVNNRIRRLYIKRLEASPDALKHLLYLEKRKDNMRYGWLRKNGYYIGSEHVEAAVRVLVVRRCKQAGMHWRIANAIRMAAIHARYRSHRRTA